MVHIINGEIVQDDDPRVKARFQSQQQPHQRGNVNSTNSMGRNGGPPPPAYQAPGGPSPLQTLATKLGLEGTILIPAFLGLPARPVEKIHIAIVVLLTFLFGWRALVFVAVAYFLASRPPTAAAAPPPGATGAPLRR